MEEKRMIIVPEEDSHGFIVGGIDEVLVNQKVVPD